MIPPNKSFRSLFRAPGLAAICLAWSVSACVIGSGERFELLPEGEGLPDREILFVLADPAATILGFLNSDGSGYVTREVRIREGFPGELLPFEGRILGPWFTWSPDGRSVAGKVQNTIAPSGVPFIITEAGELKVCPQAEEVPYYGPGRPWILSGTRAMTVAYSSSKRIYEVKSMDVEACTDLATLYSGSEGEGISEAVLSSQGWLALERCVGSACGILVLDSESNQITLIPEGRTPAWSRDGELLAYTIQGDGIYVALKDGSSARRVVAAGSADFPTWSPDAQWIAYHRGSGPGGPQVIERANISSGETLVLFEGAYYPSWRWTSDE